MEEIHPLLPPPFSIFSSHNQTTNNQRGAESPSSSLKSKASRTSQGTNLAQSVYFCARDYTLSKNNKKKSPFLESMSDQKEGRPLPKFGEWDANDPSSGEGFTVIFNKARNDKRTGSIGKPADPPPPPTGPHPLQSGKPQTKKWFCCMQIPPAES